MTCLQAGTSDLRPNTLARTHPPRQNRTESPTSDSLRLLRERVPRSHRVAFPEPSPLPPLPAAARATASRAPSAETAESTVPPSESSATPTSTAETASTISAASSAAAVHQYSPQQAPQKSRSASPYQ